MPYLVAHVLTRVITLDDDGGKFRRLRYIGRSAATRAAATVSESKTGVISGGWPTRWSATTASFLDFFFDIRRLADTVVGHYGV